MKQNKRIVSEICKEFNLIIEELIQKKICRDYSYFSTFENENEIFITRNNRKGESNILYDSNKSVEDMMGILLDKKEYNILLYDKGIIQLEFTVKEGLIIKERFIYINKQSNIFKLEEIIEMDNDENNFDWYNEFNGIPVLIRMDYDKDYEDKLDHPMSHLTISNCECCRIPMKGPMSISMFINFILNMFYDEKINNISTNYSELETLREIEKDNLYLYWN